MSEGHLWFSIFSRPLSSKFTRVQRCTCCFVLLFTAMLFNILYYEQSKVSKTASNHAGLSLGPFYFSREEVCSYSDNISKLTERFLFTDWNRYHSGITLLLTKFTTGSVIPTNKTTKQFSTEDLTDV